MPIWWDHHPGREPFTPVEAVVIDAAGYVLAEAMRSTRPDLEWVVMRSSRGNDAYENQPVLRGPRRHTWPVMLVTVGARSLSRAQDEPEAADAIALDALTPDKLVRTHDIWVERL